MRKNHRISNKVTSSQGESALTYAVTMARNYQRESDTCDHMQRTPTRRCHSERIRPGCAKNLTAAPSIRAAMRALPSRSFQRCHSEARLRPRNPSSHERIVAPPPHQRDPPRCSGTRKGIGKLSCGDSAALRRTTIRVQRNELAGSVAALASRLGIFLRVPPPFFPMRLSISRRAVWTVSSSCPPRIASSFSARTMHA